MTNEIEKKLTITDVLVWCYTDDDGAIEVYANVAINDSWLLQLGTDGSWSIPFSGEAAWDDNDTQDRAAEQYNANDVAKRVGASDAIDAQIARDDWQDDHA